MIRVIFLDIDGVILPFGDHPDVRDNWKRAELAELFQVLPEKEPLIVLVSDWRFGMIDQALDMLQSAEYPTPLPLPRSIHHPDRRKLIELAAAHLRLLDNEWVALDDCVPDEPPYFQCHPGEGLTDEVIEKVRVYAIGEMQPFSDWRPNSGDADAA